jgi:hypothetical protein
VRALNDAGRRVGSWLPVIPPILGPSLTGGDTVIAVAASMLTAAYHMLKNGVEYDELTDSHFAKRDRTRAARRLVKRLEDLGFAVTTSPIAA